MKWTQQSLALIPHEVQGRVVEQRRKDGYINATAMCAATGKLFNDYSRLKTTSAYFEALETDTGIPVTELIQSVRGGEPGQQGTWVHPKVAIHLAQWLSPEFAVKVVNWVHDWMTGTSRQSMPYHLRRYTRNRGNVPIGHFSILAEMTLAIIAPMEDEGYTLPECFLPDISQGKMFSQFLRKELRVDTDQMPGYLHYYEDGRIVKARAYPEEYLPDFRRHLREVWMPKRAVAYFRERDEEAALCLERILPRLLK